LAKKYKRFFEQFLKEVGNIRGEKIIREFFLRKVKRNGKWIWINKKTGNEVEPIFSGGR